MKSIKLIIFIFFTLLFVNSNAQNIIPFKKSKTSLWGMKDTVKNKTVLKPKYYLIQKIYNTNYYYYTLKKPENIKSKSLQGLIHPNGKVMTKPLYNSIEVLNGGQHFKVSKHILNSKTGKEKRVLGIINGNGKVIVPMEQDAIYGDGIIKSFYKEDEWENRQFGVVDLKSSTCSESKYSVVDNFILIERQFNESGDFLIDHYTLIDSSTKTVTETLGYISKVSDHHYLAKKLTSNKNSTDEFIGLINNKGQTVIPFIHHKIEKRGKIYSAEDSEKQNNNFHLKFTTYNDKGEIIPFLDNQYVMWMINGLFYTMSYQWDTYPLQITYNVFNHTGEKIIRDCPYQIVPNKKDSKFFKIKSSDQTGRHLGYINSTGTIIIPPIHTKIEDPKSNFILAKKESKYGVYDTNGICIIPFEYDGIQIENDFIVKKNKVYSLLDQKGKKLTSTTFSHMSSINDVKSLYRVSKSIDKKSITGVINREGKFIIPMEFKEIYKFSDELFLVLDKNRKQGVYRINGDLILPAKYDRIEISSNKNIISAIKEDTYYLVNQYGKLVNSKEYIKFMKNGLMVAKKRDEKYGLLNSEGVVISSFIYDQIYRDRCDAFIIVKKNQEYGVLNEYGKEIIATEYDKISCPGQGLILANKHGKYGYLNLKGEVVIPFIYDDANSFFNSKAEVRINNERFTINLKGERIE